jgi:hypothetical protein
MGRRSVCCHLGGRRRRLQQYDLDGGLNVVAGPTTLGSFSASTTCYPTMFAAADRTLFAAGYNDGSGWLKLVQTCP